MSRNSHHVKETMASQNINISKKLTIPQKIPLKFVEFIKIFTTALSLGMSPIDPLEPSGTKNTW